MPSFTNLNTYTYIVDGFMYSILQEYKPHLRVAIAFKWLVSKTPYLIHQTPKSPHITGCGVLLIVQSLRTQMAVAGLELLQFDFIYLWSCPFHRDLASMRYIVGRLLQVTGHTKI